MSRQIVITRRRKGSGLPLTTGTEKVAAVESDAVPLLRYHHHPRQGKKKKKMGDLILLTHCRLPRRCPSQLLRYVYRREKTHTSASPLHTHTYMHKISQVASVKSTMHNCHIRIHTYKCTGDNHSLTHMYTNIHTHIYI